MSSFVIDHNSPYEVELHGTRFTILGWHAPDRAGAPIPVIVRGGKTEVTWPSGGWKLVPKPGRAWQTSPRGEVNDD